MPSRGLLTIFRKIFGCHNFKPKSRFYWQEGRGERIEVEYMHYLSKHHCLKGGNPFSARIPIKNLFFLPKGLLNYPSFAIQGQNRTQRKCRGLIYREKNASESCNQKKRKVIGV